MAQNCWVVNSSGPMKSPFSAPMEYALVTKGNETRLYSIWTPMRMLKGLLVALCIPVLFMLYMEADYRFSSSTRQTSSPTAALVSGLEAGWNRR